MVSFRNKNVLTLVVLFAVFMLLLTPKVFAAQQTIPLQLEIANDDPFIESTGTTTASNTGVSMLVPTSTSQTPLDISATPPNAYTWRTVAPQLCEGAQPVSLRVQTNTTATNEAADSAIVMAAYNANTLITFDDYVINNGNGEDMAAWGTPFFGFTPNAVDRGIGSSGLLPAGLGVAGPLDVTWNLNGYNLSAPLGLYIQQWLDTGVSAQTTINSVLLTYDDTACATVTNTATNTAQVQQLASTGDDQRLFYIAALTSALPVLGYVVKRKLT